jgi:hypothetical protein
VATQSHPSQFSFFQHLMDTYNSDFAQFMNEAMKYASSPNKQGSQPFKTDFKDLNPKQTVEIPEKTEDGIKIVKNPNNQELFQSMFEMFKQKYGMHRD